jgi:hypothetical protein
MGQKAPFVKKKTPFFQQAISKPSMSPFCGLLSESA